MKTLLTILLFSALSAFAQSKAVIQLSDESVVEGEQILLGEIAKISAGEASASKLRRLSLGLSPNVGMKREIFRNSILLALAAAGFSPDDLTLHSPAKISVRRSSQIISSDSIREAVEKSVLNNFQNPEIEVKISKLRFPEKIELPKGKVEIFAAPMSGVRNFLAPLSVLLEVRIDGKTMHRTSANVELEMFADVLVMNKTLETNARIGATDVVKRRVRLEKALSSYLLDTDKLRGKKLLKSVSADEPLLTTSIIADTVVKVGDAVKIVGQGGKLQIIVLGEARANGRLGERIPVKNSQSGIILQATVVEEGLVKVNF